jgi:hypothetical protein
MCDIKWEIIFAQCLAEKQAAVSAKDYDLTGQVIGRIQRE